MMFEKIKNWIKANWFYVILGTIGVIYFIPTKVVIDLVKTIFITIILEHLAVLLSKNIIVFVMNDNYLKKLFTGADGILSKNETLGLSIFQGSAFLSAHLMVTGIAIAIYFAL